MTAIDEEDPSKAPNLAEGVSAAARGDADVDAKRALDALTVRRSINSAEYLAAVQRLASAPLAANKSLSQISRFVSHRNLFGEEIKALQKSISNLSSELEGERREGKKFQQKAEKLARLVNELQTKEDLNFLLNRVSSPAQDRLAKDVEFREMFAENRECSAFVMSVDIRRSTELMLKARSPASFAEFISGLTRELCECVIGNNGVFDKFTGDGILAFFPEDFSGEDAGFRAVKAASECHEIFEKRYRKNRGSFTSVLTGVGLGIGIDYGAVRLLRIEGLTVVGVPVVYACRMSGANPGDTLLNQPAYEVIHAKYSGIMHFSESFIDIKHEGKILAYKVVLPENSFICTTPQWMTDFSSGENP